MVNWAKRDFKKEGITGRLVEYVDYKTSGPRVEARVSKGGHYQFIPLCPKCQFAQLHNTKFKAKRALQIHLRTHKRGSETHVSSQSNHAVENPAL